MIKEGVIRFVPLTIADCEKEKNGACPLAITNGGKIVAITAYNKTDNIVMVSDDGQEPISITLNGVTPFSYRPLNYPVIEYDPVTKNSNGSYYFVPKYIPIEKSVWQVIINERLENVKIEFDDSEPVVSKITLFKKPISATLTKIWKIKMAVFTTYHGMSQQESWYLDKDYSTYEEAEKELQVVANEPRMDIDQNRQRYFNIESLMKRQEYVKEFIPSWQ